MSPEKIKTSGNFKILKMNPETKKEEPVMENGKEKKWSDEIELEVAMPDTLDEAVQMYTEDVVMDLFERNFIIKFQNAVRTDLGNKQNKEEMVITYANWKPEVGKRRGPGQSRQSRQSVDEQFDEMSRDDQVALIARLQAKAAARNNGEGASLAPVEEVAEGKKARKG